MDFNPSVAVQSFLFVFLAEMGDKTQLLAMAFSSRYNAGKVLVAVFLATMLNHALAVLAGFFLAEMIPFAIIQGIASLSFIGFGLWTLRGDVLAPDAATGKSRWGVVVTVAVAFFFAEMGDKTQLATVSLAVTYRNPLAVLIGTTLAMVAADAIGIVVGVLMRRHLPGDMLKWISGIIFMLFGLYGVFSIVSVRVAPLCVLSLLLLLVVSIVIVIQRLFMKPSFVK